MPHAVGSRRTHADRCAAEASTLRAENQEKETFRRRLSDILEVNYRGNFYH